MKVFFSFFLKKQTNRHESKLFFKNNVVETREISGLSQELTQFDVFETNLIKPALQRDTKHWLPFERLYTWV